MNNSWIIRHVLYCASLIPPFTHGADLSLQVEKAAVVTFDSKADKSYTLFTATDPQASNWSIAQQGINGNGGKVSVFYRSDTDQKLFFKVEEGPREAQQQSLLNVARLNLTDRNLNGYSLAGLDMAAFFLEGTKLNNADLRGTILSDVIARLASFRNADLRGANISRMLLNGADLTEANLSGINSHGIHFHDSILAAANLSHATFANSIFRGADLHAADLQASAFGNADFSFANLEGANCSSSYFLNAVFLNANLKGTDFSTAYLVSTDLRNTEPTGSLLNANLENADLRGLNLEGRDLKTTSLRGADLQNAKLANANLDGANAAALAINNGTSFQSATLIGADLHALHVPLQGNRGGNFSNSNLERANLQAANLSEVNFTGANFTGANLARANLAGADLTGATGFDASQPGIFYGDGQKHTDGTYFPQSRTIMPDGSMRTGLSAGAVFAPDSPAGTITLRFTVGSNQTNSYSLEGGALIQNGNRVGSYVWRKQSSGAAIFTPITAPNPANHLLYFTSASAGLIYTLHPFFQLDPSGRRSSYLSGTFTIE